MLELVKHSVKRYKPGIPTDPATTMGSIVSKTRHDRVLRYIEAGNQDGARLITGGKPPSDPNLARGFYVEPTVFADVTMDMRIGKEEIFGPVLSIFKWRAEDEMLAQVNQLEYGMTCSIWTTRLATAHRVAEAVKAGYGWINEAEALARRSAVTSNWRRARRRHRTAITARKDASRRQAARGHLRSFNRIEATIEKLIFAAP